MMRVFSIAALLATALSGAMQHALAEEVPRDEAAAALDKAVRFYAENCAKHGGYVWRYSRDLTLSEGEAETGRDTVWVQPPGTPTVGQAFLDAYDATGDRDYLRFAEETGAALVKGRMQSGGWYYSIHFDPAERAKWGYLDQAPRKSKGDRRDKANITTLDDDTTTAAVRFLSRLGDRLDANSAAINAAAKGGLDAIVAAQRANGGWPQNWDRYPDPDISAAAPKASYPKDWSRKWLNDWPGEYYLNDDVAGQTIRTLLDGFDHFRDPAYLKAAVRGGEFLQSARLPTPQPAWAQQYDADMCPCWDRKFEPPSVSTHESEDAIFALIELAERTGETRFLDGLDQSIRYLAAHAKDGRTPRFLELRTNRPLFFDSKYELTYDPRDAPDHYGFIMDSRVPQLRRRLADAVSGKTAKSAAKPQQVREVIAALDGRGAWVNTTRGMRGFQKASQEGVIESETFAENVRLLSDYLTQTKGGE